MLMKIHSFTALRCQALKMAGQVRGEGDTGLLTSTILGAWQVTAVDLSENCIIIMALKHRDTPATYQAP